MCELDIMNEPEVVHYIMDEMLAAGAVVDTNKANVLEPVALLSSSAAAAAGGAGGGGAQ